MGRSNFGDWILIRVVGRFDIQFEFIIFLINLVY